MHRGAQQPFGKGGGEEAAVFITAVTFFELAPLRSMRRMPPTNHGRIETNKISYKRKHLKQVALAALLFCLLSIKTSNICLLFILRVANTNGTRIVNYLFAKKLATDNCEGQQLCLHLVVSHSEQQRLLNDCYSSLQ